MTKIADLLNKRVDWRGTRTVPPTLAKLAKVNMSASVLADPQKDKRRELVDLLNIVSGLPGAEVALAKGLGALPLLSGVVKGKGGNWLTGSVEDALRGLKKLESPRYTHVNEQGLAVAPEYGRPMTTDELARAQAMVSPAARPINQWIEGPLTKYVKSRMATPEDEVRKLAEEGILHFQPQTAGPSANSSFLRGLYGNRSGVAKSELAKQWEAASDNALDASEVQALMDPDHRLYDPKNISWLSKTDPESSVFYPNRHTSLARSPGFDHLIDELSNALNPASGLPRNLQLTPEAMKQLSMEKAVRRVADINAWRSEQAALAEKKAAEEILKREALRTYDDQWRWLSVPDTSTPEGMSLAKDLGCRGGWCTQGESAAKQYGSGGQRLHVLIDAEGRPHAQIQTSAPMRSLKEVRKALVDEGNDPTLAEEILAEELKTNQPRIYQIKPPENSWGGARVAEYTKRNPNYQSRVQAAMQDFVRNSPLGGAWSDVGDLANTGLRTGTPNLLGRDIRLPANLQQQLPQYYTQDELEAVLRTYGGQK